MVFSFTNFIIILFIAKPAYDASNSLYKLAGTAGKLAIDYGKYTVKKILK